MDNPHFNHTRAPSSHVSRQRAASIDSTPLTSNPVEDHFFPNFKSPNSKYTWDKDSPGQYDEGFRCSNSPRLSLPGSSNSIASINSSDPHISTGVHDGAYSLHSNPSSPLSGITYNPNTDYSQVRYPHNPRRLSLNTSHGIHLHKEINLRRSYEDPSTYPMGSCMDQHTSVLKSHSPRLPFLKESLLMTNIPHTSDSSHNVSQLELNTKSNTSKASPRYNPYDINNSLNRSNSYQGNPYNSLQITIPPDNEPNDPSISHTSNHSIYPSLLITDLTSPATNTSSGNSPQIEVKSPQIEVKSNNAQKDFRGCIPVSTENTLPSKKIIHASHFNTHNMHYNSTISVRGANNCFNEDKNMSNYHITQAAESDYYVCLWINCNKVIGFIYIIWWPLI